MVREIVFTPEADWANAVAGTKVVVAPDVAAYESAEVQPLVNRGLKPKEKAQVGMLRRYARLLLGLPGDDRAGAFSKGKDAQQEARRRIRRLRSANSSWHQSSTSGTTRRRTRWPQTGSGQP